MAVKTNTHIKYDVNHHFLYGLESKINLIDKIKIRNAELEAKYNIILL